MSTWWPASTIPRAPISTSAWASPRWPPCSAPPNPSFIWSHPTGAVGLVNVTPSPHWYGLSFAVVEELTGCRVIFTSRLGSIRTAEPSFVVQEHDQLYFAINGTDTTQLRDQLASPPKTEE